MAVISSPGLGRRAPPVRRAAHAPERTALRWLPQNSKPRPLKSSDGSVRRRRSAESATAKVAEQCLAAVPVECKDGAPLVAHGVEQAKYDIALPGNPSAVDRGNLIPGAHAGADAATEPCTTSPTSGRTSVSPLTQNMPQSTRMANKMLKPGPASSTTIRCQGGLRVKERARSAGATGPSRSSSILT